MVEIYNQNENGIAAGYVRVSTEKQKEDNSHERQKERLEDWADREEYEIHIYQDVAVSGQKDDRQEFQEMMENIDDYEYLVIRDLSRATRSLKKLLEIIEELEQQNVDFISLDENIDTNSAQGKVLLQLIGAFNEFFANKRREETMRLIEEKKEKGDHWGRPTKLNDEQMEQVKEWRQKDISYNDIVKLVEMEYGIEIDRSTIFRYCKNMGLVGEDDEKQEV
jgi:DNA invertase Pin-like site-specific DNA recombinase